MEFTCPLCFRWIDIHEHQIVTGTRFICHRCGGVLLIAGVRPFSVAPVPDLEKPPVEIGSGIGKKRKQRD